MFAPRSNLIAQISQTLIKAAVNMTKIFRNDNLDVGPIYCNNQQGQMRQLLNTSVQI